MPPWPADVPLPEGHAGTGLLLQMAHRAAHERLAAVLRPLGLDVRQYGVLQFLVGGPRNQRQLIDLVGVDKSTLVRILDQMEERGLAQRARDPHDRRAFIVTITATGRGRLAAAGPVTEQLGARLFGGVDPADLTALHRALRGIIAAAAEATA